MPAPLSCAHNAAPRHRTTGLAGKRDNGPMGGIKGRPGRGGGHCLDGGGRGRGPGREGRRPRIVASGVRKPG